MNPNQLGLRKALFIFHGFLIETRRSLRNANSESAILDEEKRGSASVHHQFKPQLITCLIIEAPCHHRVENGHAFQGLRRKNQFSFTMFGSDDRR